MVQKKLLGMTNAYVERGDDYDSLDGIEESDADTEEQDRVTHLRLLIAE